MIFPTVQSCNINQPGGCRTIFLCNISKYGDTASPLYGMIDGRGLEEVVEHVERSKELWKHGSEAIEDNM